MKLIPESGDEDMRRGDAQPSPVLAWSWGPRVEAIENLTYQRFAAQVRRAPDAPALTQADVTLSYAELDGQVDLIARVLQGQGVGPDVIVGLCLPRCIELVAGVLGVHKAGGACMLLEPALPPARLRLMLDLARPAMVLTLTSQQDRLAPLGLPLLCLDDPTLAAAALPVWDPARAPEAHHLASVIFTSGSSGAPKAVATPYGWIARPESAGGERHLLKTDSATTFTRAEILRPLQNGHHLFIAPARLEIDPPELVRYLGACGITHLMMTPSALSALLDVDDLEPCRCLQRIDCIGEPIPAELKRRLLFRLDVELRLGYGCTEVPLAVCRSLRRGDDPEGPALGRPMPLKEVHVLDERLRPLPPGQVGELYLGGEMARGYLHDPQQTAARFIDHPFSDVTGVRLFRSGDRGRWLESGELEILGRLDDQVKLRGFRIELGEVEAALTRQPGVRQAVVVVREDRPGERRLVGYVVGDGTLEAARLRVALKASLPEYMVPAALEVLRALPLTANGKVDRQALPAPRGDAEGATPVAARDPLEEAVAAVWGELLERAEVGAHEDFFELGGHSLLAVRVVGRLRELFGVELPVRALFEAPTVGGLAQRVREGLAGGTGGAMAEPLRAQARPARLPLSFAQQRLWFLAQWEPGGARYNIPVGWWLEGALDVGRLRGALDALLRRHEVLRTALVSHGGEPCQQVGPAQPLALDRVDVSGGGLESAREQALERAGALARGGFDLGEAPLLRAALYRVGPEQHLLALVVHHVAADGWSLGVLGRELGLAYAGRMHELGEPALQYADYALWQRGQLQGEALRAQLGYWRERLAGLQPLELPSDRPRPAQPSSRGAVELVSLDPGLTRQLRELGRREGATLYMVLLAAFQLLLHRYSGQDDIAVGSPVAGRARRELEGLVGFFVNTLVMRADLSGHPSFRALLAQVREHALGAYAHQELPFDRLVEALRPQREAGHGPLVQVMFALQNTPHEPLALPGLRVRRQALETASAKFDLTLSLVERGLDGGLEGGIEYASDLFDAATVRRLARHWEVLLRALVREPDRAVGELELLTAPEREQLLVGWNQTAAPYPSKQCLHELFEQQAARSPQAVALVCGEQEIRYGELNARANRLAHHLRRLGVGPDELVGICLERSVELVVGMLAILKAGGAYVPLDPGYPNERLEFMCEDAQLRVLLSGAEALHFEPTRPLTAVALEQGQGAWPDRSDTNPVSVTEAGSPAYLIYTSGSTGSPKGVLVDQRAVIRLVCDTDYVRLGADDRIAQLANPCFDAATFEVWGALLNGASLVITPREVGLDPQRLGAFLGQQRISTLFLTTALFNEIVRARPDAFSGIRQLLFGGEACDPRRVRECLAGSPPARLLHVYGPTETTTFATWHEVLAVPPEATTVPIGRPIANATAHVLDDFLQPVPVGVTGEFYIGGEGVALGYWRRPELTAQRFVPDPFDARPGARLYRTGDRVRRLADGSIEFQGRADQQVKLRGFRIEPGEIEQRLAEHFQIAQALVLVREDQSGDRRLVAYLLPRAGAAVPADLKSWLRERLPDYMVPSAFVALEQFPLTPNGKVDRKALPAPSDGPHPEDRPLEPPRDHIERHLIAIWEQLLRQAPIGIRDNFFDLGGHSLLAVQLMERVEAVFRRRLPLDMLWFNGGTVEAMASLLRKEYRCGENPELVPIKPGSRPPLFVPHIMGGNLFFYYDLAHSLDPEQPVYGLQARGVFGAGQPDRSVEAIAAHCIEAMRAAQPEGPYLIAGYSSGGVIAYEMARQLRHRGEPVALLALLDTYSPGLFARNSWRGALRRLLRERNRHPLQELLYFLLLRPLRLGHLRELRHAAEAHRWAHWSYRPGPLGQMVDFFIAGESAERARRDLLGWSDRIAGQVRLHHFPGSHGDMVRRPLVHEVAARLQTCIDGVLSPGNDDAAAASRA